MASQPRFPNQALLDPEDRRIRFTVRTEAGQEALRQDIYFVCRELVYRYEASCPPSDEIPANFTLTPATGGITNRLLIVTLDGLPRLLCRLFGPHTDAVINRTSELQVARFISKHKVGPRVHGSFTNGRLEGFIEGAKSLTPLLMLDPAISSAVAVSVAALHSLKFSNILKDKLHTPAVSPAFRPNPSTPSSAASTPLHSSHGPSHANNLPPLTLAPSALPSPPSATPLALSTFPSTTSTPGSSSSASSSTSSSSTSSSSFSASSAPTSSSSSKNLSTRPLWESINDWLALGMQLGPQFTGKKAETYQKLNLPRIQREMIELKAILDLLEEPLVFCHNDLLSGNILHVPATATTNNNPNTNNNSTSTSDATTNNTTGEVPSESPQVTLIDFEYGSLNYRAFDIANHFCESAGFECDWRQFPGDAHQRNFIRTYLTALDKKTQQSFGGKSTLGKSELLPPTAEDTPSSPGGEEAEAECQAVLNLDVNALTKAEHETIDEVDCGNTPSNNPQALSSSPDGSATQGHTKEYYEQRNPILEARVEVFRRRVLGFVLASHLFWGTWAVVMAANAKIDFDYLGYSLLRLEGYHYMKQSCLLAVKPLIEARILTRGPPVHYGLVGWGAAATVFHLPIIAASTGGLVSGAVVRDEAKRKDAEERIRIANNFHSLSGIRIASHWVASTTSPSPSSSPSPSPTSLPSSSSSSSSSPSKLPNKYTIATASKRLVPVASFNIAPIPVYPAPSDSPSMTPSVPKEETKEITSSTVPTSRTVCVLSRLETIKYIDAVAKRNVDWTGRYVPPSDSTLVSPDLLSISIVDANEAEYVRAGIQRLVDWVARYESKSPYKDILNGSIFSSEESCIDTMDECPVAIWPSVEALIADKKANAHAVDAAVVVTPSPSHFAIASDLLNGGVSVIVDKPLSVSVTEVKALEDLATSKRLSITCYQNRRLDGDFLTAAKLLGLTAGPSSSSVVMGHTSQTSFRLPSSLPPSTSAYVSPLGYVKWIELAFQKGVISRAWGRAASVKQGGGRLWDLGTHAVDQALCLFRDRTPISVYAKIKYHVPEAPGMDSHCHITINFNDGSTAIVDVGSLIAIEKPRFLLVGTQASYAASGFDPQEGALMRSQPVSGAVEKVDEYGTLTHRKISKTHPVPEPSKVVTAPGRWTTFYDMYNCGIAPVALSDVYRTVAVLECALQSAQLDQVVPLPLFHQ